jgi:hypothetical protein
VNIFLENAQRIFDVARADSGAESSEFAVLVLPDGGLHVIMESQVSLEAVASAGARAAYLVSRSRDGVRVTGRGSGQQCVLESGPEGVAAGIPGNQGRAGSELLRDQPLYRITSPLLTSAAS